MIATDLEIKEHQTGGRQSTRQLPLVKERTTANYQDFRLSKSEESVPLSIPDESHGIQRDLFQSAPLLQAVATPVVLGAELSRFEQPAPLEVRPWARYWARMIDCWSAAVVIPFAISVFYPSLRSLSSSRFFFAMLVLFLWVFVEAVLLSSLGTTPGKWLLRILVRDEHNQKLTLSAALERSLDVWCRGLALGIPLLSLFTMLHARGTLSRNSLTGWDARGGYVVTHKKIGWVRVVMVVIVVFGFFWWSFSHAGGEPSYETPHLQEYQESIV